ncbi:MAG: hypothetical protein Q7S32_03355 [bacterium]|nr:hypothetical protein [bacterium]
MATTRLYITNSAASGYSGTTLQGTWDDSSSTLNDRLLSRSTGDTAATVSDSEATATTDWDVFLGRWISNPIDNAVSFSTSDTAEWVIGALASTNLNGKFHVHIYVSTGTDLNTPRGTLLADDIGATNWPTTAAGATEGTKTLSTVSASASDRIVVEIGYRAQNTATATLSGTIDYGNTGSTDLTNGSTNVTTEPGWIEFVTATDLFAPHISTASMADSDRAFSDETGGPYQDIAITFDEAVDITPAPSAGDTVAGLTAQVNGGANAALTYRSGNTTTSWVVRRAELIQQDDTVVLDYDQSTGSILSVASNAELITTADASVTNSLSKVVHFLLKDKNDAAVASEAIKISVHVYATGDADQATWMDKDTLSDRTISTDSSGIVEAVYTGSSAVGATVYVVVIRTTPVESFVWTDTIQ